MKDSARECRHKKAKEVNERHCNEDTQFSVDSMDEPAEVAQAAVLNGDALHPEHLLHTGTKDKSLIRAESRQPLFPFSNKHTTTRLEMNTMAPADWQKGSASMFVCGIANVSIRAHGLG